MPRLANYLHSLSWKRTHRHTRLLDFCFAECRLINCMRFQVWGIQFCCKMFFRSMEDLKVEIWRSVLIFWFFLFFWGGGGDYFYISPLVVWPSTRRDMNTDVHVNQYDYIKNCCKIGKPKRGRKLTRKGSNCANTFIAMLHLFCR